MAKRSLTDVQITAICNAYNVGETSISLGRQYGVSDSTIIKWLKYNNIKIRPSRESLSAQLNSEYFKIIDDQFKAYWLGYIAADGCLAKSAGSLRCFRWSTAIKDKMSISQFAADIQYDGKIYKSDQRGQHIICFNNQKFCDNLIAIGYLDWKKGNPALLNNLPSNLKYHFIRGFFDGDGCISGHKRKSGSYSQYIHFSANKNDYLILEAVEEIIANSVGLPKLGVKFSKNDNSCSISWNGSKQVKKFGDWLYHNAERFLDRKKFRFQLIDNAFIKNWNNIHNWKCDLKPTDLVNNKDVSIMIDSFTRLIKQSGWTPLYHSDLDIKLDLKSLKEYNINERIQDNKIINGRSYGNKLIHNNQPRIWETSINESKTLSQIKDATLVVRKAVKALLTSGTSITSERLLRELQFAGLSRASILSTPTVMAVIKKFGLAGKWFDPCAGWGNRMLAAYILNFEYEATDPAAHFSGLLKIKDYLQSNAILYNKRFQDVKFNGDFVFTSPPFYDKEDYGLGIMTETFEEWYKSFIIELINKSEDRRLILHVDRRICERLEKDYKIIKVEYNTGTQHKAPNEWFVEIIK